MGRGRPPYGGPWSRAVFEPGARNSVPAIAGVPGASSLAFTPTRHRLPCCPVAQLLGRVSHVASTETVHPAGQFLSTRRPPAPPSPPCGPACKALGPLIMGPLRATAGVRRRRASQSPALARWRRSPPPHQRQRRTPCPCNAARHLEKIPAKHKEASVAIRARVHAMSHRVSSSRVKA